MCLPPKDSYFGSSSTKITEEKWVYRPDLMERLVALK